MIELIAVAIFAALIWFFLKNRKKGSNTSESAKPTKQETKPADKVIAPAEAVTTQTDEKAAPPLETKSATPAVEIENKPVIAQPTISLENNSLLPQDSMLRRHYLTHVRAMLNALNPRPTDSALSRHYDTQITADIARCLHNEADMEKLVADYANYQKIPARPVAEPQIAVEKHQAVIEPSVQTETASENVETNMPSRPTDATLRRHYDTMLKNQA
jgi:hypothetical protein